MNRKMKEDFSHPELLARLHGLEARILALKLSSRLKPNTWEEIDRFLQRAFESRTAGVAIQHYQQRIGATVGELQAGGLPVELSADGKSIRHALTLPNPRKEELRCRVGFELLHDMKWHDKEDFLRLTGHEDHQKVIQVMGASGYAVERRDKGGIREYRLTSLTPGEKKARAFKTPSGKALHKLYERDSFTCRICGAKMSGPNLRPDHRVPAQFGGSPENFIGEEWMQQFQALCAVCNYEKREACKRCPNWIARNIETCNSCYWASPDNYDHMATEAKTASDILKWSRAQLAFRERIRELSRKKGMSLSDVLIELAKKGME